MMRSLPMLLLLSVGTLVGCDDEADECTCNCNCECSEGEQQEPPEDTANFDSTCGELCRLIGECDWLSADEDWGESKDACVVWCEDHFGANEVPMSFWDCVAPAIPECDMDGFTGCL